MSKLFVFDFDQLRAAAAGTRQKPILAVAELERTVHHSDPVTYVRQSDAVKFHAYIGFGELRLPLIRSSVRNWLRRLQFTSAPTIQVGELKVTVGKEVDAITQNEHPVVLRADAVRALLRGETLQLTSRPHYQVGDRLWVREAVYQDPDTGTYRYLADYDAPYEMGVYWSKPYHMPREACRMLLEIEAIDQDSLQFRMIERRRL